jgi:hypothetical protein
MAAEPLAARREILSPVDADPDHRQADIEFRHLRYFAVVAAEMPNTRMRWTGSTVCLASSRLRSWRRLDGLIPSAGS